MDGASRHGLVWPHALFFHGRQEGGTLERRNGVNECSVTGPTVSFINRCSNSNMPRASSNKGSDNGVLTPTEPSLLIPYRTAHYGHASTVRAAGYPSNKTRYVPPPPWPLFVLKCFHKNKSILGYRSVLFISATRGNIDVPDPSLRKDDPDRIGACGID